MTPQKHIDEISALEKKRVILMSQNDVAGLAKLLDGKLVYVHSTGLMDSKSTYLELISDGSLIYHNTTLESSSLTMAGDRAIFNGIIRLHLTWFGTEKNIRNFYTNIWVNRADGWKLVLWQSTNLP